jgi:DNA-binding transcriptional regulator YiaG
VPPRPRATLRSDPNISRFKRVRTLVLPAHSASEEARERDYLAGIRVSFSAASPMAARGIAAAVLDLEPGACGARGNGVAILITVDGNHGRTKILVMLLVRITGNQLRARRALAGLTIEDLATRAQLHRQSVRKWEGSSNAPPSAMTDHLCRAIDVLEAEGIRFNDNGVYLQRPAPIVGTVLRSEGVAA